MGSIGKKLKSIGQSGLDPIIQGKKNFEKNDPEIEKKARRRTAQCAGCLEPEPVSFLRVEDPRIQELDGMICSKCGCAAPYLMRQDLKPCSRWKE